MYLQREEHNLSSLYCMLIGEELIGKIRNCDKTWGYIDGFIKDDVLGVLTADLGEEEMEICYASLNVLKHRHCSNNYKGKLAYWVKVKEGLIKKIKNFDVSFEELTQWLPEALFGIIQQSKTEYLLLLEEDTKKILLTFSNDMKEKKYILPGEVQLLEENTNVFKRIDGLVPLEEMKENSAAIVGLGSGGSPIAMELAAAGIGTLHLFDKDRINSANLFRHICGLRDLGRKKVDAVEDVIMDHLLPTHINKYSEDIMYWPEKLVEVVKKVDVVICATDNPQSRAMVNYICVNLGKPLILACTFDNAKIGEIVRVIPNQTACYECTRIYLKEQGVLEEDDESGDEVLPYSSQTESSKKNSRGTRTDVFIVAAMAAKIALMTLKNDVKKNGFGKLPYNYITWGAMRNIEFVEPFKFRQPFGTNYCNFNIHPKCPLCGTLAEEIRSINIEDKYDEIIKKLSI